MGYEAVFTDNHVFGPAENPTPQGFLALMKAGVTVWNEWRAAFPTERNGDESWSRRIHFVTEGSARQPLLIAQHGITDFAGFNFGDGADFSRMQFPNHAQTIFDKATFGDDADFSLAEFPRSVSFTDCKFGTRAKFDNCQVECGAVPQIGNPSASFEGSQFGDSASFLGTRFACPQARSIGFENCTFGATLRFAIQNVFLGQINFTGSTFGPECDFSKCHFGWKARFLKCAFEGDVTFRDAAFDEGNFTQADFRGSCDFGAGFAAVNEGENRFGRMLFLGTTFRDRTDFSNRVFTASAIFTNDTTFAKVPRFFNCELHEDTNFSPSSFPGRSVGNGHESRAYRTLKLAMSEHQATREEQFFFRQEMDEEYAELRQLPGASNKGKAMMYWLYKVLSGYGSSALRPAIGFLALLAFAAIIYAQIFGGALIWIPGVNSLDLDQTGRWFSLSTVSSLPIGGLDDVARTLREQLGLKLTSGLSIMLVVHKILSLLFLFLIGLALRNWFRMK